MPSGNKTKKEKLMEIVKRMAMATNNMRKTAMRPSSQESPRRYGQGQKLQGLCCLSERC